MPPRALFTIPHQAANPKKLDMTVTYDDINGDLKVRFDRTPIKQTGPRSTTLWR